MTDPQDPDQRLSDREMDAPRPIGPQPPAAKRRRDPQDLLKLALVVYIFINLLFALPIVIGPAGFFDLIGLPAETAADLGGLRWVGAALLAWAISGILVLARPGGRAIFVTTGALQLTLTALAFLYSWSLKEVEWSAAYHLTATAILVIGSLIMWWARFAARKVFKGEIREI